MSDPFADIRPYRDEEVAPIVSRLLRDQEFLDVLGAYRFGFLSSLAPWLVRQLVRVALTRDVRGVSDVATMQNIIKRYMDRMIERSTSGFSATGLERLDPDSAHLLVSNHRDIAMDPAFTNYALYQAGHDTVRIAIGDNLLTKSWVSDLMRLNKSFIVKRSVSGPRELLAATRHLSAYIQSSLLQEHSSIWIAQREGRAKDGIDHTEPVIVKMLSMSRDKRTQSFAEHIRSLRILPVAISYELDPCDGLKAQELHQLATVGSYKKGEQEDVASIARGIAGDKGRVHVSFGTPLTGDYETPQAVAAEIDRQIRNEYCLHPTNLYAYRRLHGDNAPLPDNVNMEAGDCSEEDFAARIAALPEPHQPYALGIYANAVVNKLSGSMVA